ncbi:RNA methyltransferase tRNA(m5U54)methyltransferase [Oleoguttula sp. CCFEE 5521]
MEEAAAVPLTADPKPDQLIEHEGKTYRTIREGKAYILVPPKARTEIDPKAAAKDSESQTVFYNPIQQFNRDLSVLAIRAFGRDLCERRRVRHEGSREKRVEKRNVRKEKKGKSAGNHAKVAQEVDGEAAEETRAAADKGTLKRARVADEDDDESPVKLRKSTDGEKLAIESELEHSVDPLPEDMQVDEVNGDGATAPSKTTVEPRTTAETASASESNAPAGFNGSVKESKPPFRILDALSATGLRALRYAQEVPFATAITANDMSRDAVRSIALNVKHNGLESRIIAHTSNALAHMYSVAFPPSDSHGPDHVSHRYDVIDLDPYGTAAPFIDAALHALNDGGLLCVTCTDSAVFASCGYPEKTFALYGGLPTKGPHSHEGGLRLILNSIATSAARHGLAIEPLLSLSIDFYIRVFVRVRKSPADVKFLAGKTMIAYNCDAGCGSWTTQLLGRNHQSQSKTKSDTVNWKHGAAQAPSTDRHCEHCGYKTHVAGPMWAGPLHNAQFIEKMLEDVQAADHEDYATHARIEGMLDTALDEIYAATFVPEKSPFTPSSNPDVLISKSIPEQVDNIPFFFIPSALSKVLHCVAPSEAAIKGALRHMGYRATRSHCKPGSVKTEAPWSVVWEVMREWVRQKSPLKEGSLREGMPGWRIMQAARVIEEGVADPIGAVGVDGAAAVSAEAITNSEAAAADAATAAADMNGTAAAPPASGPTPKLMKVVFDEALGRDKPRKKRLVRYQQNPRENWGPMARAK